MDPSGGWDADKSLATAVKPTLKSELRGAIHGRIYVLSVDANGGRAQEAKTLGLFVIAYGDQLEEDRIRQTSVSEDGANRVGCLLPVGAGGKVQKVDLRHVAHSLPAVARIASYPRALMAPM
jgi:hypothetical protein